MKMKTSEIWNLFRQDDNGNIFFMEEFETKEEAERALKKFEAKSHKQTYWIEKDPTDNAAKKKNKK